MKKGTTVLCKVCYRTKAPRGRSIPLGGCFCTNEDCKGYALPPYVGDLWPGETEEDFGYPASEDGTIEVSP